MRFITSFELLGMEQGEQRGNLMGKIETLKEMFQMKYLPKKQFDQMIKPLQLELARL